jgi:hypothetical protein
MEAALVLDMAAIVYHHAERGTSRFGLEEDISSAQSYPVIGKGGLTEASEGVSWSSISLFHFQQTMHGRHQAQAPQNACTMTSTVPALSYIFISIVISLHYQ